MISFVPVTIPASILGTLSDVSGVVRVDSAASPSNPNTFVLRCGYTFAEDLADMLTAQQNPTGG